MKTFNFGRLGITYVSFVMLFAAALMGCPSGGGGGEGTAGNGLSVFPGTGGTGGTAGVFGPTAGSVAGLDGLTGSSGATAGSGSDTSGAGVGAGAGGAGGAGMLNTDPSFINLAPALGAALDGVGKTLSPPAPAGWVWYEIEGAVCRDGSPTGFFVHDGTARGLLIFLEGGGACSNDHFCAFNPASAASSLSGTGQTVIGSTLGVVPDRQQPGVYEDGGHKAAPAGIHDLNNPENPFKDWSQVYIPYCTGDVFFGTLPNGSVPGLANQKFVGYENMKRFIGRIVPTYQAKLDHVILAGSSAGSFGAALNASMVQDAFGSVPVDIIMDSGIPFTDAHMPVCMQKRWREQWGFAGSLPPDCTECQQADGGGMLGLADFMLKKHPNMRLAALSGTQDEVMRLFLSSGLKDCASYDTADPVAIVLGQFDPTVYYPAQDYTDALNELKQLYEPTGRLATYLIGAPNPNFHEHLFRSEFYTAPAGGVTEAQFIADFIAGKITQVGP